MNNANDLSERLLAIYHRTMDEMAAAPSPRLRLEETAFVLPHPTLRRTFESPKALPRDGRQS